MSVSCKLLKEFQENVSNELDGIRHRYVHTITYAQESHNRVVSYLESIIQREDISILYSTYTEDNDFVWYFVEYNNSKILLKIDPNSLELTGFSYNRDHSLDSLFSEISEKVEKIKQDEEDSLICPIKFVYTNHQDAIIENENKLECPVWSDIRSNYVESTQIKLDSLMDGIDFDAGKLIIWKGDPGTGKTYALRSFVLNYKDDFETYYISDVPKFVNNPKYYQQMSRHGGDQNLFIFEDSADYLISEARKKNGPGISQMLNITDGMVSQGNDDLFLATFNEDLQELDSAIKRPGRCQKIVDFKKFGNSRACEWLENRGKENPDLEEDHYTLAELYSILRGEETIESKEIKDKAGF